MRPVGPLNAFKTFKSPTPFITTLSSIEGVLYKWNLSYSSVEQGTGTVYVQGHTTIRPDRTLVGMKYQRRR